MQNKKQIIIAVVIVVALALGLWIYKGKNSPAPVLDEKGGVQGSFSMKDLVALGKDLKCDFKKVQGTASVEGSILVSGKNIRGDFNIMGSPMGTIQSHFINKDKISYTWTSLANIGYKKAITEDAGVSSAPSDQASIVGENDKVDYTCTAWAVDAGQFVIPTNITFQDL